VPSRFNPLGFWRIVREYGVTWYSAVPTMHQLLLARAGGGERPDTGKLRFIRSCSASLAPETMQAMEDAFGVPVLEAYGMTEASHQMASNPLPPGGRRAGSVGPGTGVRIGIMDAGGNLLPNGQTGEVVIQGANVIAGYENNPEANASSFTGGWFRTGDQGYLDAGGYLVLVGRIKELINRGGEKISPREIDEVLLAHPSIAEAVCFGVPHGTWGEEVEAAVVLREGEKVSDADLLAFCKERLAEFKRPKQIHITQTIPRTATGKIQRGVVAKAYTQNAS
jgi:acyl-CoA synthetase (AMP-forming)/AMP-acid ligase II